MALLLIIMKALLHSSEEKYIPALMAPSLTAKTAFLPAHRKAATRACPVLGCASYKNLWRMVLKTMRHFHQIAGKCMDVDAGAEPVELGTEGSRFIKAD